MSNPSQGKPWHSPDEAVYHDNSKCESGSKITAKRLEGTGQKPLCPKCAELDAKRG